MTRTSSLLLAYDGRRSYRDHFNRESEMIAYGATIETSTAPHHLAPFEAEPGGYYLIVSRLVPENSLGAMLEGFSASRTKRQLIVVGGAHYRDAFHRVARPVVDSYLKHSGLEKLYEDIRALA